MAPPKNAPRTRRKRLKDADWVARHVKRFKRVRPRYVGYEEFLEDLLRGVCGYLAPLAFVRGRVKGIANFAEKICRKRDAYSQAKESGSSDPFMRVTDLCGVRIIVHTGEQVEALSQFIEDAFVVDWDNSEDVRQRLKPAVFGYRSVHYIVSISPARLQAAARKLHIPREVLRVKAQTLRRIRGLKAEIQVRTLLEHAWADISHDLTYKTEMKVPARIERPFNALAAVLEGADEGFGRLLAELDHFRSNYGAYHPREEVEAEMDRLRIVLAQERDVEQAVKLAHLALSLGQNETARDVLKDYRTQNHQGVRRALGLALCELHREQPQSKAYAEGRRFLEAACNYPREDAETLCALADAWARSDETKARRLFQEALAIEPDEPLTLCRYLEFEISHSCNADIVRWATPLIHKARARCRSQIEAVVNLPIAWSCLSLFHLLMKEPYPALNALAPLIRLCDASSRAGRKQSADGAESRRSRQICPSGRLLQRTRETLGVLQLIQAGLPGFEWFKRTLLLGLAVRVNDVSARNELQKLVTRGQDKPLFSRRDQIVILSGASTKTLEKRVDNFKPCLRRACNGLSFTLICGGTREGISRIAGDLAEQSGGEIRAFGYLPSSDRGDENPARYAKLIRSEAIKFTPQDPLQGWTDLVAAGVDPRRVKLLSYGDGRIARAECSVALALGARVGIVEDPALPEERKFNESDWQDHENLLRLPMDAMTLRAFLLIDELPRSPRALLQAAKKTHADYCKAAVPADPSLQPWNKLSEDLKFSNFHQVVYARNILESAGLGVRKRAARGRWRFNMEKLIGNQGIRDLARMEHGRWNVERLSHGWLYSPVKDVAKKQSPYLAPWKQVPKKIKDYDYATVRNWPEIFRAAGLEIYRPRVAKRGAAKSKNPGT